MLCQSQLVCAATALVYIIHITDTEILSTHTSQETTMIIHFSKILHTKSDSLGLYTTSTHAARFPSRVSQIPTLPGQAKPDTISKGRGCFLRSVL